jgi:hypothetical protein
MHEFVINIHMHTRYSDGHGTHAEIARAALRAGLDAVIITDHNVQVNGPQGYFKEGGKKILLIIGQEVHDQAREPQKNHLLVFGADRDIARNAYDPQRLVDAVRQVEGLSFIAHPDDPAAPVIGEADLGWVDWEIEGFTGLEIWNQLSEFKARLRSRLHGIFYLFNPAFIARGPFETTLKRWDELLAEGKRVVAIGGSDAHALPVRIGPLRKVVFPYELHFRGVNTHLITPEPFSGNEASDTHLVLAALQRGNCFIGYDLPTPTRGFRFTAQGQEGQVQMGDEILLKNGVTFQIRLPLPTTCRLIHNGQIIKTWEKRETCTYIATKPGAYRVEVILPFLSQPRGWIYSNPIYVRNAKNIQGYWVQS